ncbi:MAG: metallopeptidase TldD-related protein [Candidatus Eremiobacteraeota bacterium]|nr:metallopeptidase TldD-related protein [Candidatus Eremiobacteraeota bacterium]
MLEPGLLGRLLDAALARGGDYADIFCERRSLVSFRLQSGTVHEAGFTVTQGVGIRVLCGESAGYAHSDDLTEQALLGAAKTASYIARSGRPQRSQSLQDGFVARDLYDSARDDHADSSRYVALLERAQAAARDFHPNVAAINATIADEIQNVWIATSDGRFVHDRRPLISLGVQVVAGKNGDRAQGYVGDGGRTSIAFYDARSPESIACDAARIATTNLGAIEAPAGEMEMVVGSGGGGVLLHEAVGHGLESDFNRKGVSLYSGRIGERVASDLVTIYDDGNLAEERGTVAVDDEGFAGAHKVLVDRGILQGYMQDYHNGRMMGVASTGSGRRQSYRSMPQPRMCNTYMPDGDTPVDDIIGSVKRGIYAKTFAGGQVEISRGDFVFMLAEAYLIENGRITAPLKNATIVGNGPDVMTKVVAVGNDSRLANRHYTCGKGGQYVPVGVGMPTVKISSITVGGSNVG